MWFFRRRRKDGEPEPSGDEKPLTLTVPDQYPTVQAAIDAATAGSVVIVSPGRYRETIDFKGKSITVRSEDPNDRETVTGTVLDAEQRGSVVSFCSGENEEATLAGFTLTGGRGDFYGPPSGGGVTVRNGSGPTIENNVIAANLSELDGGGIFVDDSWPVIVRNRIVDNEAAGCGGGIHIGRDSVRVEGRREPLATKDIAAYLDKASPGDFRIPALEDEAEGDLSGLMIQWEDTAEEEDEKRLPPRVESNTVAGNCALAGGGLHVSDESPLVENNVLRENRAGRGGGMCFWDNCRAVVSGNHIIANEATEEGGGMMIEWGAAPALVKNRLQENASDRGRGLSVSQNAAPIIRGNQFGGDNCEAVFMWERNRATVEDNTFEGGG